MVWGLLEAEQWLNVSLPTGNHSAWPGPAGLQSPLLVLESWLVMRTKLSGSSSLPVTAGHEIIPHDQDKEEQVS